MKFPIKFIIALLALIIGISGIAVCAAPHYSAPERVVSKYVKAVNSGNTEKMLDCTIADSVSNALSGLGLNTDDSLEGNSDLGALEQSFISAPSDAAEIKSVKLLGCSTGDKESALGLTGYPITALIKIVYLDAEGEKQTFITEEKVTVMQTESGYKIAEFF